VGVRPMSDEQRRHGPKDRGKKNGRSTGAAKFREETPRKGGGLAIKDRDTALQQYVSNSLDMQRTKYNSSRQNAAESLEKTVIIA